jgi:hypothetical protein
VLNVNFSDDHDAVFGGVNLPSDVAGEASLIGWDFARFQRATKGAQQSTGSCRNHVIQGRCVRFELGSIHAIMLGDRAVYAEGNRLGFAG